LAGTRIQLCGRLTAELDGRRVEESLPGRQGRLLFVYLVVNRHRAPGRDELLAAVWPDEAPAAADAALSALFSKLRKLVGTERLEGRSELRLHLEGWVDYEAAAEALHRAEGAAGRGDWAAVWGPARVTQHIGARGFLPGEDADWVRDLRTRLEDMYVRSLDLVCEACLELGGTEIDTAERAARTLVRVAPLRESGYRYLMGVLDRRGNRAEALRVYEELRLLLRDELGTGPSPPTQELHRRLLL
jgi:DNA-binding SARP family transcriptional activator